MVIKFFFQNKHVYFIMESFIELMLHQMSILFCKMRLLNIYLTLIFLITDFTTVI